MKVTFERVEKLKCADELPWSMKNGLCVLKDCLLVFIHKKKRWVGGGGDDNITWRRSLVDMNFKLLSGDSSLGCNHHFVDLVFDLFGCRDCSVTRWHAVYWVCCIKWKQLKIVEKILVMKGAGGCRLWSRLKTRFFYHHENMSILCQSEKKAKPCSWHAINDALMPE